MSVRIEIKSEALDHRNITIRATGEIRQIASQEAWLHNGKAYPELLKLELPKGQNTPYPPGMYTLGADSFYPDKYKALGCSPRLVPMKVQQQPQGQQKAS